MVWVEKKRFLCKLQLQMFSVPVHSLASERRRRSRTFRKQMKLKTMTLTLWEAVNRKKGGALWIFYSTKKSLSKWSRALTLVRQFSHRDEWWERIGRVIEKKNRWLEIYCCTWWKQKVFIQGDEDEADEGNGVQVVLSFCRLFTLNQFEQLPSGRRRHAPGVSASNMRIK